MKPWSKFVLGSALSFSLLSNAAIAAEDELYFYNWSEYIPTEVLEEFTEETGIKVIYSTYESNESMYAKLKTHPEGYDLVVPSTYYVKKMRDEGMLQRIDKSKLPHFDVWIQTTWTSLSIQTTNTQCHTSGVRPVLV